MYLEIDEGFDAHPKTVRLCRVMGDVNAGQYLIRLWAWACRSARDGDLSGMEVGDVEAIAKYAPADGKLFEALTAVWSSKFGPWLDRDGTSLRIHGWGERQGAAIAKMDKRAADMRALRDRKKRERGESVTSPCSHGDTHVGDQTRPDQTSPDKTREGDSPVRNPGTTDTGTVAVPHVADGQLLPDTADRLVMCLKIAMERGRPEAGMWHGGSFAARDAQMLLNSIGDPARAAKEIPPKIAAFVADPSMHPWSMRKFCDQYNGIGTAKPAKANQPVRPQARY